MWITLKQTSGYPCRQNRDLLIVQRNQDLHTNGAFHPKKSRIRLVMSNAERKRTNGQITPRRYFAALLSANYHCALANAARTTQQALVWKGLQEAHTSCNIVGWFNPTNHLKLRNAHALVDSKQTLQQVRLRGIHTGDELEFVTN